MTDIPPPSSREHQRIREVREDIQSTFEQVSRGLIPDGITMGKTFRGIVPRVETAEVQWVPGLTLADMLNIRTVVFRWDMAVRDKTPVWWITGHLEGVDHVVAGPVRLRWSTA